MNKPLELFILCLTIVTASFLINIEGGQVGKGEAERTAKTTIVVGFVLKGYAMYRGKDDDTPQ